MGDKKNQKDSIQEDLKIKEKSKFDSVKSNAWKGDSEAQHTYGFYFYEGRLVEQSYEEAVRWWKKAAEQNNVNAQVDLAYCYREGQGVDKDIMRALYWLKRARENGDEDAQSEIDEIIEESQQD